MAGDDEVNITQEGVKLIEEAGFSYQKSEKFGQFWWFAQSGKEVSGILDLTGKKYRVSFKDGKAVIVSDNSSE
jgi:hypothetical protein